MIIHGNKPSVGLHCERLPRVKLTGVKSLCVITHSIIRQCQTILGQITQGKITKGIVNPGVELLSILPQCWTILQRKKTHAKIIKENYPGLNYPG